MKRCIYCNFKGTYSPSMYLKSRSRLEGEILKANKDTRPQQRGKVQFSTLLKWECFRSQSSSPQLVLICACRSQTARTLDELRIPVFLFHPPSILGDIGALPVRRREPEVNHDKTNGRVTPTSARDATAVIRAAFHQVMRRMRESVD